MNDVATKMPEELRRIEAAIKNPIEIRIGEVDFATKVNALAAAVQAVRLAHRDEISARAWAALNQAEHLMADAIFYRNDRRLIDASKPSAPVLGE